MFKDAECKIFSKQMSLYKKSNLGVRGEERMACELSRADKATYRHSVYPGRVAVLLVETVSMMFRIFSPKAKMANPGEK